MSPLTNTVMTLALLFGIAAALKACGSRCTAGECSAPLVADESDGECVCVLPEVE